MANAGTYAVNIGTGAAGGAGIGTTILPGVGTAIGAGLGALAGGLQTLLSSSDEAKQRKKAKEEYERQRAEALRRYTEQQRNQNYDQWEHRNNALVGMFTGKNPEQDPMYIATHHDTFSPEQAEAEFNDRAGDAPTFPDDPPPNYGALIQSVGQLGGTLGTVARADALGDKLDLAKINSSGNPWQAYAEDPTDPLQQLLEQSRQAAWKRTGGW